MAGLRTFPARGRGPLVVRVRFGAHGVVAEWSPVPPPGGWDVDTACAAALRWAVDHATALQIRREPLAHAAEVALARAVDEAAGLAAGSRRSLRRAQLDARLSRRSL